MYVHDAATIILLFTPLITAAPIPNAHPSWSFPDFDLSGGNPPPTGWGQGPPIMPPGGNFGGQLMDDPDVGAVLFGEGEE